MLILRAIGPLIIQQDQARASIFDLFLRSNVLYSAHTDMCSVFLLLDYNPIGYLRYDF